MTEQGIERWRQEMEAFRQRAEARARYHIGGPRQVVGTDGKRFTVMVIDIQVSIEEIEPGVSARAVYDVTVSAPDGSPLVLRDTGPCGGAP